VEEKKRRPNEGERGRLKPDFQKRGRDAMHVEKTPNVKGLVEDVSSFGVEGPGGRKRQHAL